jgi:ABC-type bacteriocin/lantibiotic exporter with double-glycine peptidase domain
MNYGKNKIIPLFINKNNKHCCVCFENKRNSIKCSNDKCEDGIICLSCVKKMSTNQLNQCPICRVEMDTFHIKKNKKNIFRHKSFNCLYENIKILLLSIVISIISYFIGLITIMIFKYNSFEILTINNNPFVFILLGLVILLTILVCIIGFKRYYINYHQLMQNS